MRTHIAKLLQSQCKAIQNAVKVYNVAASALAPPHPTVDWETFRTMASWMSSLSFMTHNKMFVKSPGQDRETVKQYLRIQRAHERFSDAMLRFDGSILLLLMSISCLTLSLTSSDMMTVHFKRPFWNT